MAEDSAKPVGLMNFVSEDQLDQAKKSRGERVEDGTLQRDKTLYEVLKENKDKKDAEFNERFKHRPPKALDEEETEFLDKLETTRREYEQQMADEEAEQLRLFQAAVAARSATDHELKETAPAPTTQEQKSTGKRNSSSWPLNMIIKVKSQPKKAKVVDEESPNEASGNGKAAILNTQKGSDTDKDSNVETSKLPDVSRTVLGLVSYSDESEDDE